ncbi:MAG: LysR family transcriptional regulator [Phycisphaerales bacterium]|nr:LysR family transcriptional regulator [Phycisphaerales bacterium]
MRLLGSELTLHKLEVLHTVAQLESVSRAAERLGIAQPVVTSHIRSIERKLGVKLTQRRGRNIAFTDEGMRVLTWADEIVTRTRDGKTYSFTRGAVVTHITTHGMHHRAQCLNMLRQLGVNPLPKSSVMEWSLEGEPA